MKGNYIVTINREFGSLGRPIAKIVAENLGIEYYDRDIVEATAKKMNLPVSKVSDEEEVSTAWMFNNMRFPLGTEKQAIQDSIFDIQKSIILELVKKESCIIVGRCSDYILQNYTNCINIYIYAPYAARYKNCVEILKMEPEEAKQMIMEVDKARSKYYRRYAGYTPDDVHKKNIMIDSSFLGVEGTAKIITQIIKEKFSNYIEN